MTHSYLVPVIKTAYSKRLAARTLDFLLVVLVFQSVLKAFSNSEISFYIYYFGYSLICALFQEQTFGKQLLSLNVVTTSSEKLTVLRRILRELLFALFSPFLILNIIFRSDRMFHDRFCQTDMISDGIKTA